jgi:hypothetical protein
VNLIFLPAEHGRILASRWRLPWLRDAAAGCGRRPAAQPMVEDDGWVESPAMGAGGGWVYDGDVLKCLTLLAALLLFTAWSRFTQPP